MYIFFIGLHLNNVRLYHKKDSNILYIIRDDTRRPIRLPALLSASSFSPLFFLNSYIYIRLRFNYKVRYVSGSPGIVLHTISRDWRESEMRPRITSSLLRDETPFCSRTRVQRNTNFSSRSCHPPPSSYASPQPHVAYVNSSISIIGTSF